jgi:hypothetical protein
MLQDNPALHGGGDFRLGLVTYNLGKDWDVPSIIKNCELAGFEAVQLRTTPRHGVEPSLSPTERLEYPSQWSALRDFKVVFEAA